MNVLDDIVNNVTLAILVALFRTDDLMKYRDISFDIALLQVTLFHTADERICETAIRQVYVYLAIIGAALQLDDQTHLSPEAISFNMAAAGTATLCKSTV